MAIAKQLAYQAGKAILQHYARPPEISYKGQGKTDPVTQADKDANNIIVQGLTQAFPDDAILAEESIPSETRQNHTRLWCVDPLDGTQEFIEHNGQFVVMIGLAVQGIASLGVVYQPTEDILYWGFEQTAWSQQGNEQKPLKVTPNTPIEQAIVMVSRSHRSQTVSEVCRQLGVAKEFPLGSVGLKTTMVGQGKADLYISVSDKTWEWDACAPEAIVKAAGGYMTDCLGKPLLYNKPKPNTPFGMVASSGPLHQACIDALQPVARQRGWH